MHYWKRILKHEKKIEVLPKYYVLQERTESPEHHHGRKNTHVSFALFNKCFTIQYRREPKGYYF